MQDGGKRYVVTCYGVNTTFSKRQRARIFLNVKVALFPVCQRPVKVPVRQCQQV